LLQHGADPTVRDSEGKTPLDCARGADPKIAEILAKAASAGLLRYITTDAKR
jgi:ankyrin repeat protein